MRILDITGLTKRFGGLIAVKGVDLTVESGTVASIIGPNGAGKTTVFNVITGVYEPDGGTIRFEGDDLCRPLTRRVLLGIAGWGVLAGVFALVWLQLEGMWEAAITGNYVYRQPFSWSEAFADLFRYLGDRGGISGVGFALGFLLGAAGAWLVWLRQRRSPDAIATRGICRTFQNLRLFPLMTVLENVLTGMDAHLKSGIGAMLIRTPGFRAEEREARRRGMDLLEFVGLANRAHTLAGGLPYGDQRRLEIARALATRPRLLLLDEPAAGLNPAETAALMALIDRIRGTGVTVLLIEHDMKVVMGISDRIAVLEFGARIAEGTPAEIRADPRVIEAYLGKDASA